MTTLPVWWSKQALMTLRRRRKRGKKMGVEWVGALPLVARVVNVIMELKVWQGEEKKEEEEEEEEEKALSN